MRARYDRPPTVCAPSGRFRAQSVRNSAHTARTRAGGSLAVSSRAVHGIVPRRGRYSLVARRRSTRRQAERRDPVSERRPRRSRRRRTTPADAGQVRARVAAVTDTCWLCRSRCARSSACSSTRRRRPTARGFLPLRRGRRGRSPSARPAHAAARAASAQLRHRESPGVAGGYIANGCIECDALIGPLPARGPARRAPARRRHATASSTSASPSSCPPSEPARLHRARLAPPPTASRAPTRPSRPGVKRRSMMQGHLGFARSLCEQCVAVPGPRTARCGRRPGCFSCRQLPSSLSYANCFQGMGGHRSCARRGRAARHPAQGRHPRRAQALRARARPLLPLSHLRPPAQRRRPRLAPARAAPRARGGRVARRRAARRTR